MWALLVAVLAGAALRIAYLNQPMRYDEAHSYLAYASQPLRLVVADYTEPNNHVLHSVLVHLTTQFGGSAPWAIRIPALIAGVMMLPLTYVAALALFGRATSIASVLLVAVSSQLIFYSTNARGYTMLGAAFLTLLLLAERARRDDNVAAWSLMIPVAALALWTLPSAVFPIGAVLLWLGICAAIGDCRAPRRVALGRLTLVAVSAGLLTLALYAPVIRYSGWRALMSPPDVLRVNGLSKLVVGLGSLAWRWSRDAAQDIPLWGVILIVGGIAVALAPPRRPNRARIPPLVIALAWSLVLVLFTRAIPPTRVWLFLIPLVLMTAADGFVRAGEVLNRRRQHVGEAAAIALTALIAMLTFRNQLAAQSISEMDDTGTLRDAAGLAAYLAPRLTPGDRVLYLRPPDPLLQYYFMRTGIRQEFLDAPDSTTTRLFVVVKDRYRETVSDIVTRRRVDRSRFGEPVLRERFREASLFEMPPARRGVR
jgi:hypothetical protein